jgi:hypothetical protein
MVSAIVVATLSQIRDRFIRSVPRVLTGLGEFPSVIGGF